MSLNEINIHSSHSVNTESIPDQTGNFPIDKQPDVVQERLIQQLQAMTKAIVDAGKQIAMVTEAYESTQTSESSMESKSSKTLTPPIPVPPPMPQKQSFHKRSSMDVTHIPIPSLVGKGQVFRGKMPKFGFEKKAKADLAELYAKNISHIVCLNEPKDWEWKMDGKDLRQIYRDQGFEVIHFPIPDLKTPDPQKLATLIRDLKQLTDEGTNILVHCTAGNGRTGTVIAAFVKQMENSTGKDAIVRVRSALPCALDNRDQEQFVMNFDTIAADLT